jgi:hypothetical protein
MISRVYTVHRNVEEQSVTYKGFDRKYIASEMELVALVQEEDCVDVYVLDDTQVARREFIRYLSDENREHLKLIGIYKRTK